MLIYTVLQQKAVSLSDKLNRSYASLYTLGGMFCPCFPPLTRVGVFMDADLIERTAICLDYYPDTSDEIKLSILIGIYAYIWQRYEGTLQYVLNKPFLDVLSEHLEIDSLLDLEDKIYENSFKELDLFCNWVYQNQQFIELNELYNAFPADMQATIHAHRRQKSTNVTSWGSSLSGFLEKIGVNGLF